MSVFQACSGFAVTAMHHFAGTAGTVADTASALRARAVVVVTISEVLKFPASAWAPENLVTTPSRVATFPVSR